ncbi:MAG: hypothetical protein R6W75_04400 [Smithellaceae bacterium]
MFFRIQIILLINETQPPDALLSWWFFVYAEARTALFKKDHRIGDIDKPDRSICPAGEAYKPIPSTFLLNQELDGGDIDALWGPVGE